MKMTIIEGTPEELRQLNPSLFTDGAVHVVTAETPDEASAASEGESEPEYPEEDWYVSKDVANLAISRIALSKEQETMLRMIGEAYPKRVSGTDIQKAIGYSTSQFAGMMGAFGRRIVHTEDYVDGTYFFDQKFDGNSHTTFYTIPTTVRDALRENGIID